MIANAVFRNLANVFFLEFAKVRFDFAKVSWQLDIRNHHMTWVVNFYRDICAKVPRELREGEGESAFWRGGPVIKSYK